VARARIETTENQELSMPIYMKIEAIKKGESLAKGHEGAQGWIEIESVQFGANRNITTPVGQSSKREASAPSISEIVVTKRMDSTSPLIFQESLIGKGGKVEIHLAQTHAEKVENFLELTLTNTLISSYHSSSSGDRPQESISFNFTKIEMKYTPYDDKQGKGTPTSSTYDLATATK
jgi:type VI secretion system secreted protein Hcp